MLAALLLTLLAGCGGDGDGREKSPQNGADAPTAGAKSAAATSRNCRVTVNDAPWVGFLAMANRLADGQAVPRAELEGWGESPAVAVWRRSQAPNVPRAINVANWIEGAWWDELQKSGEQKRNSNRFALSRSYRYCQERGPAISALIDEFKSGPRACDVRDLAEAWLRPESLPDSLVLVFLPAMPEIRIAEGEVFVDTGVLEAGGGDQTTRQIVSLLYRNLDAVPGPSPLEVSGENTVAECVRLMMNEGVAGWIEKTTRIEFDEEHPSLYKVRIVPEDFYRKAQETIDNFNRMLPPLFTDPTAMAAQGLAFGGYLSGNNAFTQTGIAMADVIVARLGEKRLREVRRSVPDFLAAFQEAALQNAVPIPEPGALGIELYESVPPLNPAVYEPLHELLGRLFAQP